jgi:methylmalonyl-CoA/ethylmalonyl-CoA epimerase
LRSGGARILGLTRIGAHGTPIFFVHPKAMGGVLTEFMERPSSALTWPFPTARPE